MQSDSEGRTGDPGTGPGPGMAGHSEAPGPARGAARRLQECQRGCEKRLGDAIVCFFGFLAGNLAQGEDCSAGPGMRVQEGAGWGSERLPP